MQTISIGNPRLFALNSFNVQRINSRGGRSNYNNELDSFIDDEIKYKAPETYRSSAIPTVPDQVTENIQEQPNNNQVEGGQASQIQPEPTNEVPMSEIRKKLRGMIKGFKSSPVPDQQTTKTSTDVTKEAIKQEALRVNVNQDVVGAGLGERQEPIIAERKTPLDERVDIARQQLEKEIGNNVGDGLDDF